MSRWERGHSIHLVTQAAVAFIASAAFFLLSAAAIPVRDVEVLIVLLGGVYLYVILLAAQRLGPLYAVPLAIAAGLAFDSFYIPPIRDFGAADWQNWLVIAIYIGMGVLIGMLAARSQRRAEASDRARGRLADEQAALRRVATLVARGASPNEVFDAVALEAARVLSSERVALCRYEGDGSATVLARYGELMPEVSVGTRITLENEGVTGTIAEIASGTGAHSSVWAPIEVEGRRWGVIVASWTQPEPPPPDTENRIAQFAELAATAIANADSRAQLNASRARVLVAADDARRRLVRDIHDGAQQRLIHTIVTLKLAKRALRERNGGAGTLVDEALGHVEQGNLELRELAHGILPSILTRGGLRGGVDALVSRLDLPVTVEIPGERLPPAIEANAYFLVAEALTNVIKHSGAQRAEVRARVEDGFLNVDVRDDGIGGADPDGTGLVGVDDRVCALGGRLRIESPAGGGTLVAAALPLPR